MINSLEENKASFRIKEMADGRIPGTKNSKTCQSRGGWKKKTTYTLVTMHPVVVPIQRTGAAQPPTARIAKVGQVGFDMVISAR